MIRPETANDLGAVRKVNLAAFPSSSEADLVDALREQVNPLISLVAESQGEVVGHILFTPLAVHPDGGGSTWPAIALGPMAVLPPHQRRGVGSALVRAGLEHCTLQRHEVVFVLGHPQFYPRFGFQPAPPLGLSCDWDVPDDVFMVAEISPGALHGRSGLVKYHPMFENV